MTGAADDPGLAEPKICPRISPRLPPEPDEVGGADGDGAAVADFIIREMRIPASTGSKFFRMPELTPESY